MIIRTDVVMPYTSNLPEDIAINTFHWDAAVPEDAFSNIVTGLREFYNDVHDVGGVAIHEHISPVVSRATDAVEIRFYDAQNEGPPLAIDNFSLNPASTSSSLPLECAVCLSYTAYSPPADPRRRRGRIYVGPLTGDTVTFVANQPPVVAQELVEALAAGGTYLTGISMGAGGGGGWGVYSRVADSIAIITAGWVDNEFDTQRRREKDATARLNWTTVLP